MGVNTYASSSSQNNRYLGLNEAQYTTQGKISQLFGNLETIGNSYNSGGEKAAALSALDTGCRAAIERMMQSRLFNDINIYLTPDNQKLNAATKYLTERLGGTGQSSLNILCAAMKGEEIEGPDFDSFLKKTVKKDVQARVLAKGVDWAHSSGIPFLNRIEIEAGVSERSAIGSITSVQPLWEDNNDLHHVFAQISWHKAPDELNKLGSKVKYDTYNAGLAYRYLTTNKNYIYGANMFFDYAPERNHSRMSLGLDFRTSQLAVSANRYLPLSTWRANNSLYEERAASGWDLEFKGQVPELPSWTGILKGYKWDSYTEGEKLYGMQTAVEYSPVPALALRVGFRDESDSPPSLEAALRFNYRFDQPQDLQFRPRTELAPVSDYVYEKVSRENIIRVQQRRKASSKLTVIQTVGANTAQEVSGTSSLFLSQTLLMPVTVTTSNTVGAIARLLFSDGSSLTLGQNTQVLIEPTLITLISGSIQYVSNGTITNIVVPGGTIVLQGTDLDIVSSGATSSSVRVRDGSVIFTGTVSGSITLFAEQLAQSINGVIGPSLPVNNPAYVSHTDIISSTIDRIANILLGQKVTPYPYEAPRIVSQNLIPGGQIVIGLRFNSDVTVSSGTPIMNLTINGTPRIANYLSGSGTNDLRFVYTLVPADAGATFLVVTGLDKNGASIMGNGKDAVFTIADFTLSLSGFITDTTPPSGYATLFTTTPINAGNLTAGAIRITSAEVGATFNYSITSSGGGVPVTGSGTVGAAIQNITGLNLTGLGDGTLTVSVTLTDTSGNVGGAVTNTTTKDVGAPTGYSVLFTTDPVNAGNFTAGAFQFAAAEVGATYNYTITSSGGGVPVTGSGTIATATDIISALNLTPLNDGTLTVSVTLTDTSANIGPAVTDTVVKDIVAPTITSIGFTNATYEP